MSHGSTIGIGFRRRTITVDGQLYPYSLYVPASYTADRAWPCLLFLHGKGERGNDGVSHTEIGIGKAIRQYPERFGCLVVMPQCPAGRHWDDTLQPVALACLEAAQHDYRIDPKRIVLTGLSMGGYGVWSLGAREHQRFAALAPICGGGDPEDAARLARIPIWCFHGADDPVVPSQLSRDMVSAVRRAGGSISYTQFMRVGHNSWDLAYGDLAVTEWMLTRHR